MWVKPRYKWTTEIYPEETFVDGHRDLAIEEKEITK